jgi:hypothetical protein
VTIGSRVDFVTVLSKHNIAGLWGFGHLLATVRAGDWRQKEMVTR